MTFLVGDQKVFLRFQNNYFYLSHEKTSEKYISQETNVLPPFYGIPAKKNRTRNYNIENIKEVLNYKRKLSELNIDLKILKKGNSIPKILTKSIPYPKKFDIKLVFVNTTLEKNLKKTFLLRSQILHGLSNYKIPYRKI